MTTYYEKVKFNGLSLFENKNVQVIVCPVNTIGVMGRGLALEMAQRYPGVEEVYKRLCKENKIGLGRPYLISNPRPVLFFATKQYWWRPSEIAYIKAGLSYWKKMVNGKGSGLWTQFISYGWPRLGCGLGGLNWTNVKPIMVDYLKDAKPYSYIHEPNMDGGSQLWTIETNTQMVKR